MKPTIALGALAVPMNLPAAVPLPEHPRPDWERREWVNLNGEWDFAFGADQTNFTRKITVPFGWGTPLSGVADGADETRGTYRRRIEVPAAWKGRRVFLVVGASDWETKATFDGAYLGCHRGGYVPFEFELTTFVRWGEGQDLVLSVLDDIGAGAGGVRRDGRLYGKQGYGDVRGVWQTVYLEARGENYLDYAHFLPDLARGGVTLKAGLALPVRAKDGATLTVRFRRADRAEDAALVFARGEMEKALFIPLEKARLWDLDDPYLYEVEVALREGGSEDRVATYFGMRSVGVGKMPGTDVPYVTLNGKPRYLRLCLDQSYHPTGFYTFPSDAFMRGEIELTKGLGLDGNRIHIKAEVPRKLYWADRLGCLVMADVPNAWGWPDDVFFDEHGKTMKAMMKRDMNHPSVFSWVLFNETWGLKNLDMEKRPDLSATPWYLEETMGRVAKRYFEAKRLDPTRLVEDNSPCYNDHVVSDINSFHGYNPGRLWEDFIRRYTESLADGGTRNYIGGFAQTGAPLVNSECGNVWGYEGSTGDVDNSWDYHGMMDAFRRQMKCAGWIYTEHHDVTNEWNGYVRFDRSPKDFGYGALFPGMSVRDFHSDAYVLLERELFAVKKPGETWEIPVAVSLVSDRWVGRRLTVEAELRYLDARGETVARPLGTVASATATSWMQAKVGAVRVTLPSGAAAGTVNFTLKDGADVIGRNFTTFHVAAPPAQGVVRGKKSGGAFSLGAWTLLDGRKEIGVGKGAFAYEFPTGSLPPDADLTLRAEVSTRPLLAKDLPGLQKGGVDLDFMLGVGAERQHANANSYPQTDGTRHPGAVEVVVGGRVLATVALPDDPADHRGILSWGYQPRERRLHEAGTYGYKVEARIPAALRAEAEKDGRLVVELRTVGACGLAVYSDGFGRYPFGVELEVAR